MIAPVVRRWGRAGAVKAVSVISTAPCASTPEHRYGTRKLLYWWLLTSRQWTQPRPMNAYVIEHAKGLILFGQLPAVGNRRPLAKLAQGPRPGRAGSRAWSCYPVGAGNAVTVRDLGIFVDEAAEPVTAYNAHTGHAARQMSASCGRVLLQRPVRPMTVVVIDVLAQDQPQMPLAGDQHPVQALTAGTSNPPFRDRVGRRRQQHTVWMISTDVCV